MEKFSLNQWKKFFKPMEIIFFKPMEIIAKEMERNGIRESFQIIAQNVLFSFSSKDVHFQIM